MGSSAEEESWGSSGSTSSSTEGEARRLLAVGLRERAGAKRFGGLGCCCWREREEALLVLALVLVEVFERRFGGAMVGWRRGAVVKGSLGVWRVEGMLV